MEPSVNIEKRNCRTLINKPGTADTLYVATDDYHWSNKHLAQVWQISNALDPDTSKVIRTQIDTQLQNNGDTVHTERFSVAVTKANPEAVYVACNEAVRTSDTTFKYRFKMWKYENNNWNLEIVDSTTSEGIGYYKFEFQVSPTDENVCYWGGLGLEQEVKTGQGWQIINFTVGSDTGGAAYHTDTRKLRVLKGSMPGSYGTHDVLYVGNDGGISKSNNGSGTWANLNGSGLMISQLWGIGGANTLPYKLICGLQDNSGKIYDNGSWGRFGSGDWGDIIVNNNANSTMYGNCFGSGNTNILKSIDGGVNWLGTKDNINNEHRLPNSPLRFNPKAPNTVYFGAEKLYRSYHGLDTAYALQSMDLHQEGCNNCFRDPISSFAIAPSDTSHLYVVFDGINWNGSKKFFRSTNNGLTWKNLTDSVVIGNQIGVFGNYSVSNILADPKDPLTIWMTLNGFYSPNHDSARVIVSHNGGATFSNYSEKLPNMPVNCITRLKGNGIRLLVGTDVGVFYRDSTLSQWVPFNTMLPGCVVTDLEVNDSLNVIRAATYGRGLWETTLDCVFEPQSPSIISSNQHWVHDTAINNSIYIDSSYTLTISSKVTLAPMAKIYVKQGARLNIDRGILTNKCFNMWQGIEVWGRTNKPPTALYQGVIVLTNGARVENARIGITTCRKSTSGEIDFNTAGGMVYTDSVTFRNNYKAVEIIGNPRGQYNLFRKTLFETTVDFVQGATPGDFVSLVGANGVQFLGCTFRNTATDPSSVPGSTAGRGIFSINSFYTVDHYYYCPVTIVPCPNPIIYPTLFQGLRYGIRALGSSPDYPVTIRNSRFKDNYRSVYLSCIDYAEVTKDTFELKNFQNNNDTLYGLYISKSTGYKIQENRFFCKKNSLFHGLNVPIKKFGVVVDSSGSAPNEIYRNNFDSLDVAINAQRLNRSPNDSTGLVIKCNTYHDNSYDEIISYQLSGASEGIASKQGAKTLDPRDPAGNTFSPYHVTVPNPSGTLDLDIKNRAHPFRYFHHIQEGGFNPPRVKPTLIDTTKVLNINAQVTFNYSSCCPSKLSSGGGNEDLDELKQALSEEQIKEDSLANALLIKIDGGNTDSLRSVVVFSNSLQSIEIKEDLMQKSPYLSDTVMKSAIEKETVLPNEMIRDIMVANPQFTQSESVLTKLDSRFTPMPDYMLDEILAGSDSLSPKEELDAKLQSEILKRKYAFNELIRFYKNDTVNPSYSDSLHLLLEKEPSMDAHYKLAFDYFESGDTTMSRNIMAEVPVRFDLTGDEQKQHDDYLRYIAFLQVLNAQNRSVFQLNAENTVQVQNLRLTTSDPVSMYCQNILEANGKSPYNELVLIPDDNKSITLTRTKKPGITLERNFIKIFPNPARDYCIVEYQCKEMLKPGEQFRISIVSLDGKIIFSTITPNYQDQLLINTSSLKTGIYLCTMMIGNRSIRSATINVVH